MTYKEFYIWLEGFMTNRDWVVIKQVDIETIQEKMKDVKDELKIGIAEPYRIPIPVNPIVPPFYPTVNPIDPIKPDWTYRPDQMPYYGTTQTSND
jgi:hypothetical protein